jgi:hypothetical protein
MRSAAFLPRQIQLKRSEKANKTPEHILEARKSFVMRSIVVHAVVREQKDMAVESRLRR